MLMMDDIGATATLEPLTGEEELEDIINSTHLPSEDNETQDCDFDSSGGGGVSSAATSHTCGFCGDAFSSYAALLEHKSKHGGDRPYACHVCDKRFTQKAHLIIHRRTHTGEKPYSCHICHKRFAQSSHLNSHKRVHTGEKPFFCSICNMGFCRRQRLEVHLQQHARDVEGLMQASKSSDFIAASASSSSSPTAKFSAPSDDLPGVRGGENSSSVHQAVFPDFTASDVGESPDAGGASIKQEHISDSEENGYGISCSPTQSLQRAGSTPKNRRKPAFVRRLGTERGDSSAGGRHGLADQKYASGDDSVDAHGNSHANEDRNLDLSAHEAAVDALIKMATGGDLDDADHVDMGESAVSDDSIPHLLLKHSFLGVGTGLVGGAGPGHQRFTTGKFSAVGPGRQSSSSSSSAAAASAGVAGVASSLSSLIRTNNRVTLVDFTADDLLRHLMSRDDVYRCDFCRVIFHDAAMYHLHRSMHDKMDIRCCNLCGKLLVDKYDFTAHFLSQHK